MSNIPESTVTRIFNGKTPTPAFDTFARIAIALGASLDEISGFKQPDVPPVDAHIENTLNSYIDLIREKDARIEEKERVIEMIRSAYRNEQMQRKRTLWFFGAFVLLVVAVLVAIILFDVGHNDIGFLRY